MAKRGERGKAYFMISAVSQKYDIHPQTLRLYEREGLLKPSRTEGNTRLYSEEDLEQLETILTLTRDLGVNLAGVEIILNLRRKIELMQAEVNEFMGYVKREMARGIDDWEQRLGTALVKSAPTDLVRHAPPAEVTVVDEDKPKRKTNNYRSGQLPIHIIERRGSTRVLSYDRDRSFVNRVHEPRAHHLKLSYHDRVTCSICEDTGWKSITIDGVARVTRCECWRAKAARLRIAQMQISPRGIAHCTFGNFETYERVVKRAVDYARRLVSEFPARSDRDGAFVHWLTRCRQDASGGRHAEAMHRQGRHRRVLHDGRTDVPPSKHLLTRRRAF